MCADDVWNKSFISEQIRDGNLHFPRQTEAGRPASTHSLYNLFLWYLIGYRDRQLATIQLDGVTEETCLLSAVHKDNLLTTWFVVVFLLHIGHPGYTISAVATHFSICRPRSLLVKIGPQNPCKSSVVVVVFRIMSTRKGKLNENSASNATNRKPSSSACGQRNV